MKLIRSGTANHTFLLADRERVLLMQLLGMYPRVPAEHHKATKSATPQTAETERLLKTHLASSSREIVKSPPPS